MTALRLAARAATLLLCLTITASALTSDEEVDEMLSNASRYDAAGKGQERDDLEESIRLALRGRLAADSSTSTALSRLDWLEELATARGVELKTKLAHLKTKALAGDTGAIRSDLKKLKSRFPKADLPRFSDLVAKPAEASAIAPAAVEPSAVAARHDSAKSAPLAMDSSRRTWQPRCPDGGPQVRILRPAADEPATADDSALVLQIRLVAPCPLARVQISRDSTLVRILNLPAGQTGSFELDDAIGLVSGTRSVTIVACDTFRTCAKAELALRSPQRIPPWIPWTSGGLVLLGLATGVFALFRKPSTAAPAGDSKQARGLSVRGAKPRQASSQPTDIQESLKAVIADAEKGTSRGPRLISRMNTAIPAVEADAQQLELAFRSLLKLPLLRAGLRGTVLVATGRGPVNMEVVLEDNGPDIEDASVRSLFDASVKNRERQGLDKELAEAADILGRLHGHLAAEPRIDGGLRLRIRLPLPSASGPRAGSLLK